MNAFESEPGEGAGNMPPGFFFGDVNQPSECGNLEFLNSGLGDATQHCDPYRNIPVELLEKNNWLVWKFIPSDDPTKEPRKVPFNPRTGTPASTTNPATWTSHEEAVGALAQGSFDGLGFVFDGQGICGIDLDDVIDAVTGEIAPWALDEINYFGSYVELSPSGTGFHIICKSEFTHTGVNTRNVEIYSQGRFFTFTNNLYDPGLNTLEDCTEQHRRLYAEYGQKTQQVDEQPKITCDRSEMTLLDKALCDRIADSKQGPKFIDLFNGQWSGKYPSQSEADSAMLFMLAFWTGKDTMQMDRIFRASKLFRAKWDSLRGDTTYGSICIAKAVQGCHETIGGGKSQTHYTAEDLRDNLGQNEGSPGYEKPGQAETKQDGKKNRFGFTSAAELCKNPVSTKWLIKNFVPEESFILIFGVSGCGKTFYILDVLLSISSQVQDCLGSQVKKHGPVFYLCGEGHSGLPKRIKAWCLYRDIDPETIKFFASKIAVDMLDPESVKDMIAGIDELASVHGQPVLIGIDTVNRNMSGDENSTKDMSAFVAASDYVKNKYQCTVYAAHHPGLADTDRSRGSNALRGALDTEFKLAVVGDHKVLTCTKSKNTEPPAPIQFSTKIIELDEVDEDGQPVTSLVFVPTDAPIKTSKSLSANNKMALDALEFIHGDKSSVHLDEWRKEFYARSTADTQDTKRKTFERARKDLVSDGRVACREDHYWIFVVPGQTGQDRTNPDIVPTCPA